MYLKSLTMKGFKSFASATTMKFEPGICAVVGPNGSGKSNVVDALAWVMGEQGAKTLRGGKMDDVIFAGAGGRKPLGRAEVTLTIDNTDGALDIEYSEVSITRRMFRDGASEYEINGSRARLMDIQELLSDSGIGKEMHVIVGQGKLAEILESRPEDRRAYIEEAAGVLKHRRRKEKAQRKLVGMQANLDRLQDLCSELGKQLKPLARQAEAAQKAASVQAVVRETRLALAGDSLARLDAELSAARTTYRRSEEKLAEAREHTESLSASLSDWEAQLEELSPRLESMHALWFELSSLSERLDATARIAHDRMQRSADSEYQGPDEAILQDKAVAAEEAAAELSEQKEIAVEQCEEIAERYTQVKEQYERAQREQRTRLQAIADHQAGIARLMERVESSRKDIETAERRAAELQSQAERIARGQRRLEDELASAKKAVRQAASQREPYAEEVVQAKAEAAAAEERLEQVHAEQRELDVAISRLQSRIEVLEQQRPMGTVPSDIAANLSSLAEHLTVETRYSAAVAVALGAHAESLVGSLPDEEIRRRLVEEGTQRTAFIEPSASERWRLDANIGDHQWLLDLLDISDEVSRAVVRLLVDVVLVPSVAAGREVIAQDPRLRAVTPEGVLLGEGWMITAEHGDGHAGSATHAVGSSSVEIAGHIAEARAELEVLLRKRDDLAGSLSGTKQAAAEARVNVASTTATLREYDALDRARVAEVDRLMKAVAAEEHSHQSVLQLLDGAHQERVSAQEEYDTLSRLLEERDSDTPEDELSSAETDSLGAQLEQLRQMDTEARLRLASVEQQEGSAVARAASLRSQAVQAAQQRQRHEQRLQQQRRESERARVVVELAEAVRERLNRARDRVASQRAELENLKTQVIHSARRVRDEHSAATHKLTRCSDARHEADRAVSTAEVRLEETALKLREQTGVEPEVLREAYAPPEDFDRTETTARLKNAEKQLAALGKVNPLALEEYQALEERYSFLTTQLADVERARSDLQEVIKSVDARILQLFSDAWSDVEAEFPRVFATLFPGGEGRLILTDPQDLLGTGIDVEARPPGKKVKRLSLLSGGEKSLTAVAMLVAIFKARPSPFYVMDEVEAALDDVNLRRLLALFEDLRETSQLIVITHQKPTMDIANVLYGVTMRGDGVTQVLSQRMTPHQPQALAASEKQGGQ